MTEDEAKKLVAETLGAEFNRDAFARLLAEMLEEVDADKTFSYRGVNIPAAFGEFVDRYDRVGQYADPDGKIVDLLVVRLKRRGSAFRARTAQRAFVANYLKNRAQKDAALVAFHCPGEKVWRFSLVRMEYELRKSPDGKLTAAPKFNSARRHSFLVGRGEKTHTAQIQLADLLVGGDKPKLKELEDAFSVEPVTERFFREYRKLYQRALDEVNAALNLAPKARRDFEKKKIKPSDFAKKLLGQIAFLYFLQRKGWLGVPRGEEWGNGPDAFLRDRFEEAREDGRAFYGEVLQPLFYEALCTERSNGFFSAMNCRIPFLNGGLFEPPGGHDWVNCELPLPNSLFSGGDSGADGDGGSGVLDVFDRYNFTVAEDDPVERAVAVDPEMLGMVFENLIEENERKAKGAFYTPRDTVHFMCRESLALHLADEAKRRRVPVGRAELDKFIEGADMARQTEQLIAGGGKGNNRNAAGLPAKIRANAAQVDNILRNIRVCDPAVGSGAFVVGMMQEIVRLRNALSPAVAEPGKPAPAVYDMKLEAIRNALHGADIDGGAVDIAQLRLWLSLLVDEESPDNVRPLPNLDHKLIRKDALQIVPEGVFNFSRLEELERLEDEFFSASGERKKRLLRQSIAELVSELTDNGREFDLKLSFSSVFRSNRGFDIVIGNPPYVRQEDISKSQKSDLRKNYPDGTAANSDLFVYFYLRGLQLLHDGGIHAFICSNGWLYAEYGAKLEERLLHSAEILGVYDNEAERSIATAAINTVVTFLRNREPENKSETRFVVFRDALEKALRDPKLRRETVRTRAQLKREGTRGREYVGGKWGGRFLRAPDIYHVVMEKAKDKLVRLEEIAAHRFGVKTGANGFFHLDKAGIAEWGIERRFLRPLVKSARDCEGIVINPAALRHRLFVCRASKADLKGTNALRYIQWGEGEKFHKRASVVARPLWYSLPEQSPFDCLLLRFRHERVWTPVNESPAVIGGDTMFVARYRDGRAAYQANCYANSTLFAFFAEILARVNFGEGIAVTNGPELADIPFPSIWTLLEIGEDELSAFELLKSRPVKPIREEMKMSDRRELDAPFFAALGLTRDESDAVYEGMSELIRKRLLRAETLPGGGRE